MGKLDDIRKQREAQFAEQHGDAGGKPRSVDKKTSSDVVEGKCAECGKLKAIQNGLVASHQKGLGKMCPGARKEPQN